MKHSSKVYHITKGDFWNAGDLATNKVMGYDKSRVMSLSLGTLDIANSDCSFNSEHVELLRGELISEFQQMTLNCIVHNDNIVIVKLSPNIDIEIDVKLSIKSAKCKDFENGVVPSCNSASYDYVCRKSLNNCTDNAMSWKSEVRLFGKIVLFDNGCLVTEKLEHNDGILFNSIKLGAGGNTKGATTDREMFNMDDLNNDGIKSFFNLEESDMDFVFKVNFTSSFLVSQVFSRRMLNRDASIINISSMSAYSSMTKVLGYSAAKSAINSLTQWMATYFAKAGIRVNAIAPGFFTTEQNKALLFNEDGSLSARSNKIINGILMGRFGDAKKFLGAVLWLADSNSSRYVTGIIVPIDGGYNAYSGV